MIALRAPTMIALRALVAFALVCSLSSHAAAQSDPLAAAEAALADVNFPDVLRLARAALEGGGLSPERLARAYELIGLANSAEGNSEPAREAYTRLLALAPDADPARDLAPRLRSPFLEARGFWSSRRDRLGIEVTLLDASHQLRVELSDPLHMGASVVVGVRPAGSGEAFQTTRADAQPVVSASLGDARRFEYYVAVLDPHGNRIVDRGSEAAPEVIGEAPVVSVEGGGGGPTIFEEPAFWIVTVAIIVAAAVAIPLAIYFTRTVSVRPVIAVGG